MYSVPYDLEEHSSICSITNKEETFAIVDGKYVKCIETGSPSRGKGIWLYSETESRATLDVAVGWSSKYDIDLAKGWNIIGNPYPTPLSLSQSTQVDGVPIAETDAVSARAYRYENGIESYEEATILEPWRGYLIYAKRPAVLTIYSPENANSSRIESIRIVNVKGDVVDSADIDEGDILTLRAAAYDSSGEFVQYVPAVWRTDGSLPEPTNELSDVLVLEPHPGASGRVSAFYNDFTHTTGDIVTVGSGDLFEYPFTENATIEFDHSAGLATVGEQALFVLAPGVSYQTARDAVEAHGGKIVGYNATLGLCQIRTTSGPVIEEIRSSLERSSLFKSSFPNYLLSASDLPNDPIFANGADSMLRWGYEKIRMGEVWNIGNPSDESAIVAVIDSGIDINHPELAARVMPGRNFIDPGDPEDVKDDTGHGSAVAGIIAAQPDNELGIAGICSTCRIMPLKACDASDSCPLFSVVNAISYATQNGADVINMSFGAHLDPTSPAATTLKAALSNANAKNIVTVAAAGNNGASADTFYPAAIHHAISVGATTITDSRASYSNFGATVDISAPGDNIYSTAPGGGYAFKSGTSLSAGYISGLAGLVKTLRNDIKPQGVKMLFQGAMKPLYTDMPISGLADAYALIAQLTEFNSPPVVTEISYQPDAVLPGGLLSLVAEAIDPDGDSLSYTWQVSEGSIVSSSGKQAEWKLPESRGERLVTVEVYDSFGNSSRIERFIQILDSELMEIRISPSEKKISSGYLFKFKAYCYDTTALTQVIPPIRCTPEWNVSEGIGTISASGDFIGVSEGTGKVTASIGSLSGESEVMVSDTIAGSLYTEVVDNTPCYDEWLQFRCNQSGSNESSVNFANQYLTNRWAYSILPSFLKTQPFARKDPFTGKIKLYFITSDSKVHCVNQDLGTKCWDNPLQISAAVYNEAQILAQPAFSTDKNFLYVAHRDGNLYKVDISGAAAQVVWTWTQPAPDYEFYSMPLVIWDAVAGRDVIYFTSTKEAGNRKGRIYAVEDLGLSGSLKWTYPSQLNPPISTPFTTMKPSHAEIEGTNLVFVINNNGILYGVDLDGELKKTFTADPVNYGPDHKINSSTTVADYGGKTYVYTVANQHYSAIFRKFDPSMPSDSAHIWEAAIPTTRFTGPPAHSNGIFYFGTYGITPEPSSVYAIRDLGGSWNYEWPAVQNSGAGRSVSTPLLHVSGIIQGYTNSGALNTITKTGEKRMDAQEPIIYSIQGNSIILPFDNGSTIEPEAYIGIGNYLYALEQNFEPVVDWFVIESSSHPAPACQKLDGSSASATAYLSDPNKGIHNLSYHDLYSAVLDLSNIGAPNKTLTQNLVEPKNRFHNKIGVTPVDIVPALGLAPGDYPIILTVTDKGGLTKSASRNLTICDSAPEIIGAQFAPDYLYPNGTESSTLSVTIEDLNAVISDVHVDVSGIQGGGPANWQPMTCGAFDSNQQAICTLSVTASAGTPLGPYSLNIRARDATSEAQKTTGSFNADTNSNKWLKVVDVGYFTLSAAPDSVQTGDSSTVSISAYYSTGVQIASYDNPGIISITTQNTSGAGVAYSGTGVSDSGSGVAQIAANSFSGGQHQLEIFNTQVESGVTVTAKDINLKSGVSNAIAWTPADLGSFTISAFPLSLVVNAQTTVTLTAYDIYGNLKTDFDQTVNLDCLDGVMASFTWSGTGVTPGAPGTAALAGTQFVNGVATSAKLAYSTPGGPIRLRVSKNAVNASTIPAQSPLWDAGPLGSFLVEVIVPPVGNPTTYTTATLRITAYDTGGILKVGYNNTNNIVLLSSGNDSTIAWSGTNVTPDGAIDGKAYLSSGAFAAGVATFNIYNEIAQTTSISVTEYDTGNPGVSGNASITWESLPPDHITLERVDPPLGNNPQVNTWATLKITVYDSMDNVVTDYDNTLNILLSGNDPLTTTWSGDGVTDLGNGQGTLAPGWFDFGSATVRVMNTQPGAHAPTATEQNLSNTANTNIFWDFGPLGSFDLTKTSPAGNPAAGDIATIEISAKDIYGNLITTYNNTNPIALSVETGTSATTEWSDASLGVTVTGPGTATLEPGRFTGGKASVKIRNTTSETQTIRCDEFDAPAPDVFGTGQIDWDPGPLDYFVLTPSATSVLVGQNIDFSITAYDGFGNVKTDFSNPNGLLLTQTGGTASGFTWSGAGLVQNGAPDYTATISGNLFVAGVYSPFSVIDSIIDLGVKIKVVENVTLNWGESAGVDWTPGPLHHFVVSSSPTALAAGETSQVTVTAYDNMGNIKIDWNSPVRISCKNGTLNKLLWSGPGVAYYAPGQATLSGAIFSNGIATGNLTHTLPEGPIFIEADSMTGIADVSDIAQSPTWSAGPLDRIVVMDAANGAGAAIGAVEMNVGGVINAWAAGYDAYDNFLGDIVSAWSTTGTLDPIGAAGPADSSFFQPLNEFTSGLIRADGGSGVIGHSGTISVLSSTPRAPVLSAAGGVGKITLSWPAVTKFEDNKPLDPATLRYKIWMSDTEGTFAAAESYVTALGATSFELTVPADIETWKTYYFKITAWFDVPIDIQSSFSNTAAAAAIVAPFTTSKTCAQLPGDVYIAPDTPGYVNRPSGIAIGDASPSGYNYVYIADNHNNRVSVFDEDCNFYETWGEYGNQPGQFIIPNSVLYDSGNVYVCDSISRVQKFSAATGQYVDHGQVIGPWKMAMLPTGRIIVATHYEKVANYDPGSLSVDEAASFDVPDSNGVVYNPVNGLIYISDKVNHMIRAYDASGTEQTGLALGFGKGSHYGQLDTPAGLAVDGAGNIYVADSGNDRIQVFSVSNQLINVIGGYGAGVGKLRSPYDVAISQTTGLVWVSDYLNQRFTGYEPPLP
ncbi:MAG TPA: S8 family serine peptidase [bacterium]|nr:S8 family serine peptidase [bacterium]